MALSRFAPSHLTTARLGLGHEAYGTSSCTRASGSALLTITQLRRAPCYTPLQNRVLRARMLQHGCCTRERGSAFAHHHAAESEKDRTSERCTERHVGTAAWRQCRARATTMLQHKRSTPCCNIVPHVATYLVYSMLQHSLTYCTHGTT